LKYVPLAIVVKPDSRADGTLIVVERTERSLTVSLNQKTGRHQQERRAGGITYRFKRLGFCLLSGYAFTDYWTQGMSFGHDCWLSHLTPPPTGKVKRPSIYVVSSRHEDRPAWIPIAPLWPPGDTQRRAQVIQIYFDEDRTTAQGRAATSTSARRAHTPPAAALDTAARAADRRCARGANGRKQLNLMMHCESLRTRDTCPCPHLWRWTSRRLSSRANAA
jgi:hypothetical protein